MRALKHISFLAVYILLLLALPAISQAWDGTAAFSPTTPMQGDRGQLTLDGPSSARTGASDALVVLSYAAKPGRLAKKTSSVRVYCGAGTGFVLGMLEQGLGYDLGQLLATDGGSTFDADLMGGLGIEMGRTVSLGIEGGFRPSRPEDYTVLLTLELRGR